MTAQPIHAVLPERAWRAEEIFTEPDTLMLQELKEMPLSIKIGQMLIADCPGGFETDNSPQQEKLESLVRKGKIGGVMFLKGGMFKTAMLANHLQSIAPRPLLLSSDMENGAAMRLQGATEFPPAMAVAAAGRPRLAKAMGAAIAAEAKAVGIRQNYAPVGDLNSNPLNPVINTRSFSDNPETTSSMTGAYIEGLQKGGLIATIKHFPGHGNVHVDSHLALPVISAQKAHLEQYELEPFRAAILHGVMSVMVGHLAVPAITGTMEPATLSPKIITELLRNQLGFRGLVVTDALNMKALYNGSNIPSISVQAVLAGNDLLLFSPDPELTHSSLLEAVNNGTISEERINRSVARILQAKRWLKLRNNLLINLNRVAALSSPPSHRELASELSKRSITLTANAGNIPLKIPSSATVLHLILSSTNRANPAAACTKEIDRHWQHATHIQLSPATDPNTYLQAQEMAEDAAAIIISSTIPRLPSPGSPCRTTSQQKFIHQLTEKHQGAKPVIFIALGTPYILNLFPEIKNSICTFSGGNASEKNAILVLAGKLKAEGKTPIKLSITNNPPEPSSHGKDSSR
jgi:beta-N-acetylhexosaminidase